MKSETFRTKRQEMQELGVYCDTRAGLSFGRTQSDTIHQPMTNVSTSTDSTRSRQRAGPVQGDVSTATDGRQSLQPIGRMQKRSRSPETSFGRRRAGPEW